MLGKDKAHHQKEDILISKLDDVLQNIPQLREEFEISLKGLLKAHERFTPFRGLHLDLLDKEALGSFELLVDVGVCDRKKSLEKHLDATDVISVSSDLLFDGRDRLDQGAEVVDVLLKRNEETVGIGLFPLKDLGQKLDGVVAVFHVDVAVIADHRRTGDAKAICDVGGMDHADEVRSECWRSAIWRTNKSGSMVPEGRGMVALMILAQIKLTGGTVVVDGKLKVLVVLFADPTLSSL